MELGRVLVPVSGLEPSPKSNTQVMSPSWSLADAKRLMAIGPVALGGLAVRLALGGRLALTLMLVEAELLHSASC